MKISRRVGILALERNWINKFYQDFIKPNKRYHKNDIKITTLGLHNYIITYDSIWIRLYHWYRRDCVPFIGERRQFDRIYIQKGYYLSDAELSVLVSMLLPGGTISEISDYQELKLGSGTLIYENIVAFDTTEIQKALLEYGA